MNTGKDFYNDIEELIGTYPSGDALRNAAYALIADAPYKWGWADNPSSGIFKAAFRNTEMIARKYETDRGTHYHIGGRTTCDENCNTPESIHFGDPSLIARKGNCDPFVNFDHSDCTGDECKFDEGAYL